MIKEYLLKTDSFYNPTVLEGSKAIGTLLIRLLVMVPGINPRHPEMGVGIGTIYRFVPENDIPDLESLIHDQIATYLPPEFRSNIVNISIGENNNLIINITIEEVEYIVDTEDLTDGAVYLSNLT